MAVNDTNIEFADELIEERSWRSIAVDLLRRQPMGAAGGVVVLILIFTAIFAPYIDMYDPK